MKKFKTNLQDHRGSHLFFRSESFIIDLQITMILPTKFRASKPLVPEKKGKIDFQDGRLKFPIRMIKAIFIYKSPRYFLPSF